MPSGYTQPIYDNEPITFEQFALNCARGMGAGIHQRDDLSGGGITERKLDSYYAKNVQKAEKQLTVAKDRTDDEWGRMQADEISKAVKYRDEYVAKRDALNARYGAMLKAVYAWIPPTGDHSGLKTFMLDQLEQSLNFDCGTYVPSVPKAVPTEVYRDQQLAQLQRAVASAAEDLAKEQERVASQNEWVRKLRESLKEN